MHVCSCTCSKFLLAPAPVPVAGADTCSVPLLVSCSQPPSPPSVVFPSLANQHVISVTISRQHIHRLRHYEVM